MMSFVPASRPSHAGFESMRVVATATLTVLALLALPSCRDETTHVHTTHVDATHVDASNPARSTAMGATPRDEPASAAAPSAATPFAAGASPSAAPTTTSPTPTPSTTPSREAPRLAEQGADACDLEVGADTSLVALAALGETCARRAGERRIQRSRLLLVSTRGELARVAPTLADAELSALARLVSGDSGAATALAIEPLETARFVPLDDDVLARARGATAVLRGVGGNVDERTRAEAWLAELHIAAIASLGVSREDPPPPFVRLLAAQALDHGRRFVTRWVQRRVEGTERAVSRIEREMDQLVLWLDREPGFGDPPEVAWALELARDHLRTASSRARRAKARPAPASTSAPAVRDAEAEWIGELERRIAAGMIPRALSRGRAALAKLPAPERDAALLTMASVLRRWGVDADRLSRGAGDPLRLVRDDLGERLQAEEDPVAAVDEPPSALVPEEVILPTPRSVVLPTWASADEAASRLVELLRVANETSVGIVASLDATRLARARPDGVARALELAADDPSLERWQPWLRAWWAAHVGRAPMLTDTLRRSMQLPHPGGDAVDDAARRHRVHLALAADEAQRMGPRR